MGGAPAVRVTDMEEVIAQAIKSRRWLLDTSLWETIGNRLAGRSSPRMQVVEGNARLLEVLCGLNPDHPSWSIAERAPIVVGRIAIAQPGLSYGQLLSEIGAIPTSSALQIRELLTVLHDAVSSVTDDIEILCSE